MKKIIGIVLALVLLVAFWVSPVAASPTTYQAIITHTVIGSGVVGYSESPNGHPYDQNPYGEPAMGGFRFWAKCSVAEMGIGDGAYEIIPGTLKTHGFIWTSWTHDGTHYSIQAWVSATVSTQGAIYDPLDYYGLGTLPDETSLAYRGYLTEGATTRPIEGYCAVTVGAGMPGGPPGKISGFGIYVDDATRWLVLFGWSEEPAEIFGIEVPAAKVFQHKVMVR